MTMSALKDQNQIATDRADECREVFERENVSILELGRFCYDDISHLKNSFRVDNDENGIKFVNVMSNVSRLNFYRRRFVFQNFSSKRIEKIIAKGLHERTGGTTFCAYGDQEQGWNDHVRVTKLKSGSMLIISTNRRFAHFTIDPDFEFDCAELNADAQSYYEYILDRFGLFAGSEITLLDCIR